MVVEVSYAGDVNKFEGLLHTTLGDWHEARRLGWLVFWRPARCSDAAFEARGRPARNVTPRACLF